MFDWFKNKDTKPSNVLPFPEPKVVPPMPQTVPPNPLKSEKPKAKEHYRVGKRDDDMTTLTLMSNDGYSVTLSMNEDACEQLIKLLRATYE